MNINPKAKSVLFYGDSFVFGKIPGGGRWPVDKRFTGIVQKELGPNFEVIEEGLRGRTINGENSFFPYRNGLEQFGPIFGSHLPLDLVVLFLGTNDINSGSHKPVVEIVKDFEEYKKTISWWCAHLNFIEPKVMLIAPPCIQEQNSYEIFKDIFKGSQIKTSEFPEAYKQIAQNNDWLYFNSGEVVKPSEIDGIHLDEMTNVLLGKELARVMQGIW